MLDDIKSSIICAFIFVFPLKGQAQMAGNKIHLLAHAPHLKVRYVPFDKVIILDNTIDTSKIGIFENGRYPPECISFDQPPGLAIKDYIEKIISPIQKGNKTLLINIKELYIPNRGIFTKKRRKGLFFHHGYSNSRDYVRFRSDIYVQTFNCDYQKIATLRLSYFMRPGASWEPNPIGSLLNELIACASLSVDSIANANRFSKRKRSGWAKYPIAYDFAKDTTGYPIDKINIPALQRWGQIPIIKSDWLKDGIFESFEDFQEGRITADTIALIFNEKDSLYRMRPTDSARFIALGAPWAIGCSGSLFIQIGKNIFLKLHKQVNTFAFYIPHSLPDMYTILSLSENYRLTAASAANSGNIFFDLASIVVIGTIDGITKASTKNRINRESIKHNYRNCFINMESGDIIFN